MPCGDGVRPKDVIEHAMCDPFAAETREESDHGGVTPYVGPFGVGVLAVRRKDLSSSTWLCS